LFLVFSIPSAFAPGLCLDEEVAAGMAADEAAG
jgi:hypothetical protein